MVLTTGTKIVCVSLWDDELQCYMSNIHIGNVYTIHGTTVGRNDILYYYITNDNGHLVSYIHTHFVSALISARKAKLTKLYSICTER